MGLTAFLNSIETMRALLVMTASGAAITAVLLAVKPLIRKRLPKTALYYLWLVALAAFLLPLSQFITLPQAGGAPGAPIYSAVQEYVISAEEVGERIERGAGVPYGVDEERLAEITVPPPAVVELIDWWKIIWALGMFAALAALMLSYHSYNETVIKRHNKEAAPRQKALLAELATKPPRLFLNEKAATPMLVGLFRPAIILPDREYADGQLRGVLLHELAHLRRKDILVKWLAALVCALHWFNPFAWLARREIDRACELACDEAVIRRLDAEGRQSYGDTLIAVAADSKMPRLVLSTTMCERKKSLKERLGAIMEHKKTTRLAIVSSVALVALLLGLATILGAGSGNAAADGYNFNLFVVNKYQLNGVLGEDALSALTPSSSFSDEYQHNYEEIRFDLDDNGRVTRFSLDVYDEGIFDMYVEYAQPRADGNGIAFIGDGETAIRQIKQVEDLLGKGKIGWHDRGQGLRYERYKARDGGGEVAFVYSDGESDGVVNRLVWVIAKRPPKNARPLLPNPRSTSSGWLGNLEGDEMPLAIMKAIARNYVRGKENPGHPGYKPLAIDDLSGYKSINASSDMAAYNMHYTVTNGIYLIAMSPADYNGIVDTLSIRRVGSEQWLEISSETLDLIDSYVSGEYTPPMMSQLWNVATPHDVPWSESGTQFAWRNTDNPTLALLSSRQYLPSNHFENAKDLAAYVAASGGLFGDGFAKWAAAYDGNFFADSSLTLVYIEKTSRSTVGEIGSVSVKSGGTMEIGIPGLTLESGSIARFIAIEHSKEATRAVKNYVAYIERAPNIITPLTYLPADYSMEQAIHDNVYVNVQSQEIYNQIEMDIFYENALAGVPAFVRAMIFTEEGDPIITDYKYDGKTYTVITDNTRDKWGIQEITTATYKYLVPLNRSHPYGALDPYYLSNQENIFKGTDDGGTTLIDGLGMIPSPSETANLP